MCATCDDADSIPFHFSRRTCVGDAVIIGMSNGNANAEEMVIEEHLVLPKPKTWAHVQAAGVMVGFLTGNTGDLDLDMDMDMDMDMDGDVGDVDGTDHELYQNAAIR